MYRIAKQLISVCASCLNGLAVAGICFWPVPVHAAEPTREEMDRVYARFATIEEGLASLDRLEARLERQHTDPLARARSLDNDPAAIIEDVTETITYLPYAGSLRAADGTLASRAGNAVDQAVLLATMLNRAGLEARVVRGEISEEDATRLVTSLSRPAPGEPAYSDEDMAALREKMPSDVPELSETFVAPDPADGKKKTISSLDEEQAALIETLGRAAPPEEADLPAWMMEVARDYWWVQYRDEPAGAWSDAHPAFPDGEAPSSLEGVEESFYNSLPRKVVQRITLRLEMEIQEGDGDRKTVRLAELENIPGSELARNPVTLAISPDTLLANPEADLKTAMEEAHFMAVGVNGQRTHDPFSLSGVVLPPEALGAQAYGMADLFATVSDRGELAIAALSGDENTDVLAIRELRLIVTSRAPGLPDRNDVRILYDAVASDGTVPRRPSAEIASGLTGVYMIGARTGRISDTRLAQGILSQARGFARLIEYDVFRNMVRPDQLPPLSEVKADLDTTMPLTRLAYEETRQPRSDGLGGLRNSLSRLGLNAKTVGLKELPILMPERPLVRMIGSEVLMRPGENNEPMYGFRRVTDLVSSPVLAVTPDATSINPRESMRSGLWMSRLEGALKPAEENSKAFNTRIVLDQARAEDIPVLTLVPAADPPDEASALPAEFAKLDLPQESLDAIKRDLDAGFAVVTSERLPENTPYGAWWRVHPQTGETLAMLGSGRGSETVDFINLLSLSMDVLSAISLAEGLKECLSDDFNSNSGSLTCCLLANTAPAGGVGMTSAGVFLTPQHPAVKLLLVNMQIIMLGMGGLVSNSASEACQR